MTGVALRSRKDLWPEDEGDPFVAKKPVKTAKAPNHWREWLRALFPSYTKAPPAPRHVLFWDWLWAITQESDPRPFVGIWPRGGAKSTSAELGTVALGVRGHRKYALYVRGTQDRADDSVQNIAKMLESAGVALYYPKHSDRAVGKFGDPKGWRRNRLRTAAGFTVDALGLDVAARGLKIDEDRPDLIVFDDVDARHDTPHMTDKKLITIKESVIPAGTANVAIIGIQNRIIPRGVFSQLADGTADFLARRIMSGPEPAVLDLKTESRFDPETGNAMTVITGGTATWAGQDLAACQALIGKIGFGSFNREAQQNVKDREGALWTSAAIDAGRVAQKAGRYKRVVTGVDPSGGRVEIGIIGGGLRYDGHVEIFADRTQKGALGPHNWGAAAVDLYDDTKADVIAAEGNFGGDMVKSNIKVVGPHANVKLVHASRGKDVRAEPVASEYGDPDIAYRDGRVHHVGHFPELEAEMTGWVPGDPESPNRLDALVWVVTELLLGHKKQLHDFSKVPAIQPDWRHE